jgi:hypothetical protein
MRYSESRGSARKRVSKIALDFSVILSYPRFLRQVV